MAKTSVSHKVLAISAFCRRRLDQHLQGGRPEVAIFWAAMIHSLFALAAKMSADGQMGPDAFWRANQHGQRAFALLLPSGGLGLHRRRLSRARTALAAYGRFREEAERVGIV
jgi:hypothetical protein